MNRREMLAGAAAIATASIAPVISHAKEHKETLADVLGDFVLRETRTYEFLGKERSMKIYSRTVMSDPVILPPETLIPVRPTNPIPTIESISIEFDREDHPNLIRTLPSVVEKQNKKVLCTNLETGEFIWVDM